MDSLVGITIVQGWIYLHENRDTWGLRSLVSVNVNTSIYLV
jgi:hypothetical protein